MLIQIPTQPFTSSVTWADHGLWLGFSICQVGTLTPAFEGVPWS